MDERLRSNYSLEKLGQYLKRLLRGESLQDLSVRVDIQVQYYFTILHNYSHDDNDIHALFIISHFRILGEGKTLHPKVII